MATKRRRLASSSRIPSDTSPVSASVAVTTGREAGGHRGQERWSSPPSTGCQGPRGSCLADLTLVLSWGVRAATQPRRYVCCESPTWQGRGQACGHSWACVVPPCAGDTREQRVVGARTCIQEGTGTRQPCGHTGKRGHMSPSPSHRFSSLPGNQVARAGRSGTKLPARHQQPAITPPHPAAVQLRTHPRTGPRSNRLQ